jgi:GAF domain-containing protein/anti-sigma regulatory factor (Ser/Thr protein kinase)
MPLKLSTAGASEDLGQEVEELRRALSEAQQREAATAEVLKVIGRSRLDLKSMLGGLVESAVRLAGAEMGLIYRRDGDLYRAAAIYGGSSEFVEVVRRNPIAPGRESAAGRAVLERRVIHIHDVLADPDYTWERRQGAEVRTILAVPLRSEGGVIGVIVACRTRIEPFAEKQIELLTTFAEAVIAIENTRLFEAMQARTQDLSEALEQQAATSEILSVISRSPGDLKGVFDIMLANATRLCQASYGGMWLSEGDGFRGVAFHGALSEDFTDHWRSAMLQPGPNVPLARAARSKKAVHVADLREDRSYLERDPLAVSTADTAGVRTLVVVPMLLKNELVGAIAVYRTKVLPFSDKQIDLLSNFASQAVIAIQSVRLLNELRESLQQQTATAEVLKVISRSTFDLPTVLNTLVESAARLCEADKAELLRPTGKEGRYAAVAGYPHTAEDDEHAKTAERASGRQGVAGRVLAEGKSVQIADVLADPDYRFTEAQRLGTFRTHLGVPLLGGGSPAGLFILSRTSVRAFTKKQTELAETFADQAVIALENARLFEEVQARTRELSQSLQQQTATADVLKTISRSALDLQSVLDALVSSASHLCDAPMVAIHVQRDASLPGRARYGFTAPMIAALGKISQVMGRGSLAGRTLSEGRPVHIPDVEADADYEFRDFTRITGARSMLGVPLVRDGRTIGLLSLYRTGVAPFTSRQVELMASFADQAVIAIENARLFGEVQARNRDLTALGEVGRAVSSTLDLKVVLKTIVERAVDLSGTNAGSIFYYRERTGRFELGETTLLNEEAISRKLDIAKGETGLGEAIAQRRPLQIPDVLLNASNSLGDAALAEGLRATLIVPLLAGEEPRGALVLQRRQPGEFSQGIVSLMQSFADQSVIALENARLFEEIARNGRELEIASQHKSQFVANMSHELRTPLAAMLGYAELIQEGFYGQFPDKSMDALTRIRSNGRHLLGLINTVLDIAKIESGQFSLNLAEYALENVVETVRAATESLAETKRLALKTDVGHRLPIGLGDEQRLTQVLLNLVGNAIKFTDAGEVCISVAAVNGHFAVRVTDTGPGIPPEEQTRIFEQFHQVDSSNTKAKGGTGLGLSIAKQIVEMHGGRIWVESKIGKGATFQMQLPVRAPSTRGAA